MFTFGSLFTGIGGFDLGLEQAEMTCDWQVEIDTKCSDVLAHHWPEVRRYGNIKEIGSGQLEAVDLISAGWPCQDLSIAGKRAGLAGERSGLFFQALRIIQGLKPRWFLLEQVPGLFSQNKGQDFAIIIQALAECGYGVAWRVLNAQYFGVAQRRRRVFIVGSLGDTSCAKVLFESEGSAGDTSPCGEAREGVAAPVTPRVGGSGSGWPRWNEADGLVAPPLKASTPSRRGGGSWPIAEEFVVAGFSAGQSSGAYGIAYTEEGTPPLRAGASGTNQVPTVTYPITTRGGQRMEPTQDTYVFNWQSGGDVRLGINNECAGPLQANQVPAVAVSENQRAEVRLTPYARQLTTGGGKPGQGYPAALTRFGVRRLTPTECERLQGFPSNWTAVNEQKDSARYRQLGNAVCVPVAKWIGRQILASVQEQS